MSTVFDLTRARELMKKARLDCTIATSHGNVLYCSGADIISITGLKRLAAIFLPLEGEPVFGVQANEEITARRFTWIEDVRVYMGGEWEPLKAIKFIADTLIEKDLGDTKIGMEMLDMPSLCLTHLQRLLPSAEFVDCQAIFDRMRVVKSPEELKLLSEANMATAKAITVGLEMARPGDSERKIARNMINLALEYGADHVLFMTLAAGENVVVPNCVPSDYQIKKGDLVHVDLGCSFQGYLSDIARTAVVGEPDETQLKAYDIVVRAERVTAEAMRKGAKVIDVHNAVKQFYESNGLSYEKPFIGHGLGISLHELPFLGPSQGDWVLESGMFFQVEPSFTIGQTRTHTEDSFIVLSNGAKNVSEYRDVTEIQVIR